MDAQHELLVDLTAALAAGAVGSLIAIRLKLHPILGYLGAGVFIGPLTPGYVAHPDTIETLATLGLVFFLFSLGLGISPQEIRRVGIRALLGNVVIMTVVAGLGAALGVVLGLKHPITVGLLVSVSSTAVGNAVMEAHGLVGSSSGHFADAQLAFQDFASVAMGISLPLSVASSKSASTAVAVLKASGFVVGAMVLGATVLQRVARHVVARAAPETKLITGAAVALTAAWAGHVAGLSFAFGAFVAGALLSKVAIRKSTLSAFSPFRAAFAALFFVFLGMLFDPGCLVRLWLPIVVAGVALVLVRFCAWSTLARASPMARGEALAIGATMTGLGELNVALVEEALKADRIDEREHQVILGIVLLSIVAAVVIAPFALARLGRPAPKRQPRRPMDPDERMTPHASR